MLILWKGCPGTRNVGCCGSGKAVMNFLLGLHELKPLPADRCLGFFPILSNISELKSVWREG